MLDQKGGRTHHCPDEAGWEVRGFCYDQLEPATDRKRKFMDLRVEVSRVMELCLIRDHTAIR